MFYYVWLFTLTAHLISCSEFQTDLPIRSIQTTTDTIRRQHFQKGKDNGVGNGRDRYTTNIASEQVEPHDAYIRRLHIGVEDVHHFKQFNLFKIGRCLNPRE